jgi:NAD(P)-dependent dehydrogenase (short-subunit alcohol dehydrogenase family)
VQIRGQVALVTGGGSGLGEATARELAAKGARVAVIDLSAEGASRVAADINNVYGAGTALAYAVDVTSSEGLHDAFGRAGEALGPARILMHVAGIGTARRIVGKNGTPAPLEDFERVVRVNLIGTYNAARLFASACATLPPLADGERGVMVFTASVAAFDGQVGQQAYSASKSGVVGMTLPMARDLAQHGIRVCTIAPGLFDTPLMRTLPEAVQQSLGASIPFPSRLGQPREFAELACHIVTNVHLNGEVIRLDGALRLPPR